MSSWAVAFLPVSQGLSPRPVSVDGTTARRGAGSNMTGMLGRLGSCLLFALLLVAAQVGYIEAFFLSAPRVPVPSAAKTVLSAVASAPVCQQVLQPGTGTKVKPQTEMQPVILVVEDTETDPALEGGWELILYNDEFNSRHHVARTLTMVCQLSDDRAYDVMMTAHKHGSAVVGEYTKDVAESYCEGLRAAGIGCDVTKADSPE